MKQTAVEYIQEKLQGYGFDFGYVIEQAKEMEKEQMIELWNIAVTCESFEQYYNETFKSE
jgi:hypothetical protein